MIAGILTPRGVKSAGDYIEEVMTQVKSKNPAEPEFHQAVQEVFESLRLVLQKHAEYRSAKILERIVEPERVIIFRVPWFDDQGNVQVNRGFRIEMNSAIGPYKGGLRFHASVNLGILKFLAFVQVFKNSLTTLPMGGGNVSQYTIEKLLDLGAKPVTVSDSNGVIYDPDGIDREKLAWVMELKNVRRGRIRQYTDKFNNAIFMPTDIKLDHNPLWNIKGDCAFPSATQNEITAKDAANLITNGVKLVAEGANMPSTLEATKMFLEAKVLYGPAKAANAGGVATSGLEMAQNSARLSWTREEVDDRLHKIMIAIHRNCFETAEKYGTPGNLVNGANIGGFLKVANAMLDQGLV